MSLCPHCGRPYSPVEAAMLNLFQVGTVLSVREMAEILGIPRPQASNVAARLTERGLMFRARLKILPMGGHFYAYGIRPITPQPEVRPYQPGDAAANAWTGPKWMDSNSTGIERNRTEPTA